MKFFKQIESVWNFLNFWGLIFFLNIFILLSFLGLLFILDHFKQKKIAVFYHEFTLFICGFEVDQFFSVLSSQKERTNGSWESCNASSFYRLVLWEPGWRKGLGICKNNSYYNMLLAKSVEHINSNNKDNICNSKASILKQDEGKHLGPLTTTGKSKDRSTVHGFLSPVDV